MLLHICSDTIYWAAIPEINGTAVSYTLYPHFPLENHGAKHWFLQTLTKNHPFSFQSQTMSSGFHWEC